jgi:uncharacterized damage-inducible protein DinB
MNLSDLRTLLDYHYWARNRVLDAAAALTPEQLTRDMGSSFKSVRDTLVHMYSSEWAWYSRWQGVSPTAHLAPEQFPDVASLRQAWSDHEVNVRSFLDSAGEAGVSRVFEYRSLAGQPGASTFSEMVQHVVNHGSYHRGQVTTMLRQLGAAPPKPLDLIAYHRTEAARAKA